MGNSLLLQRSSQLIEELMAPRHLPESHQNSTPRVEGLTSTLLRLNEGVRREGRLKVLKKY